MMKGLAATLYVMLSTAIALLISLPIISNRLWKVQIAFSEFPGLLVVSGILVGTQGKGMVRIAGLYSVATGAIPFWQRFTSAREMNAEMAHVFGQRYKQEFKSSDRSCLQPFRLNWCNLVTECERTSVSADLDVVYLETPQRTLKLDIYRPRTTDHASLPAIIMIHGGGWRHGDKREYFSAGHRNLAQQGYIVFDVQYRLTEHDEIQWPTPLEDVRAAKRFVKRNASSFGVDLQRVALYGRSSGGHLALMAAYLAYGDNEDTRVSLVVGVYPPANLLLQGPYEDPRILDLLGQSSYSDPERYQNASPLRVVTAAAPPTLLIHGQRDWIAVPYHTEMLRARLQALGVSCVVLRVPWSRHGFDAINHGLGTQLIQVYVDRFLAHHLYPSRVIA